MVDRFHHPNEILMKLVKSHKIYRILQVTNASIGCGGPAVKMAATRVLPESTPIDAVGTAAGYRPCLGCFT